jgi:hypothetical protein
MKCALGVTTAVVLILAAPIDRLAAQTNSPPAASDATRKDALTLSEQDKTAVIAAAVEAKSHQKTPQGFTPAVGASVPRTLYVHAFNPEIARKVPILKRYGYSYLDREIVLIDGMQEKVVAVIPLPAKYMIGSQGHHGAAEPSGQPKDNDDASPTGSVPAYTSPETIK